MFSLHLTTLLTTTLTNTSNPNISISILNTIIRISVISHLHPSEIDCLTMAINRSWWKRTERLRSIDKWVITGTFKAITKTTLTTPLTIILTGRTQYWSWKHTTFMQRTPKGTLKTVITLISTMLVLVSILTSKSSSVKKDLAQLDKKIGKLFKMIILIFLIKPLDLKTTIIIYRLRNRLTSITLNTVILVT